MITECDICGFKTPWNPNFCGGCGVDMREPKKSGEPMIVPREGPSKKRGKPLSKKGEAENENVIHWCGIRAICNSFEMTFPLFLTIVLILARGKKHLGFCDCTVCNQGYRELQAWIKNGTEQKNLTANSREIVIEARNKKIDGLDFDISQFLKSLTESPSEKITSEHTEPPVQRSMNGKITIEIDSEVLEDAVFNVLRSERGKQVIQSIPRKRKVMREAGVEPANACANRS